jgi:K+-sensing histidine kinase KdpD
MNEMTDGLKDQLQSKYEEYLREKINKQFTKRNDLLLHSNRKMKSCFLHNFHQSKDRLVAYLNAVGIPIVATLISFVLYPYLGETNLIMVYFLGITIVALKGRIWPSILASILSILAYDFFFIPPFYSFSVSDVQYFFTLIIMLVIAQIITHLTLRVRRHVEVAQNAEKETEKERFRNILLTSVSHDLRTPLTAIMGSASSLLQSGKILSEEMHRELAQNIYDESERLNHLVNNILKIIRLEAGTIQLSKQPHALEEMIGIALNKLEMQLANKPVTINIPKLSPLIPMDNILIGQVFINLIENAIKYTPIETPIDISVEFKVQKAIIKIADRGTGIHPKDIDNIFDKFYRGQKPETSGLGLGLAICKGIILAHKGTIWAEPRDQGGSVFCFTLPITG